MLLLLLKRETKQWLLCEHRFQVVHIEEGLGNQCSYTGTKSSLSLGWTVLYLRSRSFVWAAKSRQQRLLADSLCTCKIDKDRL